MPKKAKLHKKAEFYNVATTGIKKELFIFDFDVKKADLAALAVMSVRNCENLSASAPAQG